MDAILNFDWNVFQWVEQHLWCNVLDKIFPVITFLGDNGYVWLFIALILTISKKYRKVGVVMFVALVIDVGTVNVVLKNIFSRPRPFDLEEWQGIFQYPGLVTKPDSFSFPSGHTAAAFAGATALATIDKKRVGVLGFILAILIGFSRIYVHVHYCTDVLAGIVVGVLCGVAAIIIVKWAEPRIAKKLKKAKE